MSFEGTLTRRSVAGVFGGALLTACSTVSMDPDRRDGPHLGVQLYTVGDAARADVVGTFRRLGEIGFRAVELAGFHGHSPSVLGAAAADAGLQLQSIHLPINGASDAPGLNGDLPRLAARLRELGISDVVVPMIEPPARLASSEGSGAPFGDRLLAALGRDDWRRLAALLNERGGVLRREGLRLGYHNHNMEFAPLGASSGWEILIAETDPSLVNFQLDVGWAAAAGLDPVELLLRSPARVGQLHLKDVRPSTKPNFALRQDSTEVGSGVIAWDKLLQAARSVGVRGWYVEQEPPYTSGPFEALAKSYAFLEGRV